MNNVLRAFVETKTEIDCKIIVFGDYTKSPNASMIERNIEVRKTLLEKGAVPSSVYQLKIGAKKDLNRGVKLMNKEVESLINGYDNIIVDISALPKVLYFNLVRSIYKSQDNKNLSKVSHLLEFPLSAGVSKRSILRKPLSMGI